jgi:hypothetical protein
MAGSGVTPSLAVVRLLQGFGGTSIPVGFVASQLGLEDKIMRGYKQALADQHVVKLDRDSVSIA